jgi:hypothetical protein
MTPRLSLSSKILFPKNKATTNRRMLLNHTGEAAPFIDDWRTRLRQLEQQIPD